MTVEGVPASLTGSFLGENHNHVEANFSAKQSAPSQDARISSQNGDESRSARLEAEARQGSSSPNASPLLKIALMNPYLRGSRDFQKVYRQGRRYDSSLMTAFVLPNNLSQDRLGITASRKAVGNAVQRNRARRLLKETFRLKRSSLVGLQAHYDWVINAKRRLPSFKVIATMEEFEKLVARVANEENKSRQ